MVKLSVIVPYFNVRPFITEALRTLRANVRENYEIVFVDDCSTDGTPDVVAAFVPQLRCEVRQIRHEKNSSIGTARNTGLRAATGEYLTFLDGDDWLAHGYLPALVEEIERLGVDFIRTDQVRCTARARTVYRAPIGPRGVVLDPRGLILPDTRSTSVDYPYSWAGLYHRRLYDAGLMAFPEGLHTAEDRPWIWKLHREAESCAAVNHLGYYYRRGVQSSLTQIGDTRQLDFIAAFDQLLRETAEDPDADRLMPKAVRTYCAIITHHLGQIERFEPAVARQLKAMSAAALRRMPQDVLDATLSTLDHGRSSRLAKLRRRPATAEAAA
ncbi:glycosyltransferase family 2 protein [Streptomyces fuscigenes]|uniref:glycosyltransferase family 2 protein n=1 Tax=Streptomyces fuscigenes TaxID=1528880 RepID=UPI001F254F0E|nr:glycosyltransferase family 2 protein [Streptomyces fuscigenes]MCF3961186.1 glycosyltransferase [Streptomyces fuscigenes]